MHAHVRSCLTIFDIDIDTATRNQRKRFGTFALFTRTVSANMPTPHVNLHTVQDVPVL